MNLIVDIGNTRTKYAVFDEGDWVECGLGLPEVYDLATTYRKSGKEVNLILSSTGAISAEVRERFPLSFVKCRRKSLCRYAWDMIPRRPWVLTGLPVVWAGHSFFRAGSCW